MMAKLQASTRYEVDADGFIHLEIGLTGWSSGDINRNLAAFLDSLNAVRPVKTSLGKFVERIALSAGGITPAVVYPRKELLGLLEEGAVFDDAPIVSGGVGQSVSMTAEVSI
jgi:hypothetical protein